jgi:hypothetical protein
MAVADWFLKGALHVAQGDIDWLNDDIKIALLNNLATPDLDVDEFWSDLVANEAVGDGYTAGGFALVTVAPSIDAASNEVRFDAADGSWDASAGSLAADYAVVYKDTGVDATSILLGLYDFEGTVTATEDIFGFTFDATGVLKMVAV